MVYYFDEN